MPADGFDPSKVVVVDFSRVPHQKALEAMGKSLADKAADGNLRAAAFISVDRGGAVRAEFLAHSHDGHFLIGGSEMLKKAILDQIYHHDADD